MIELLAHPALPPAALIARHAGLAAGLCSVGILIQSLEVACNRREFSPRGLLGWPGSGTPARSRAIRAARALHGPRASLVILAVRAIAAGLVLAGGADGPLAFPALTALLLGQLYYNRRFYDIASNADALSLATLAGLWVACLPGASEWLRSAGLLFVAGHVLLGYFGTGKNKLATPAWRNGERLTQVFRQGAHGFAPLGRAFTRRPGLAAVAAWSVILLELAFPLGLLLPEPAFFALLAAGLCFHAAVAFTMGLHDFFWAFAAGYPALCFARDLLLR